MTSIEWLEEELAKNLKLIILNQDYRLMETLFEQAKEIHKQEIIDAGNLPKEKRWYDAKLYNSCGEQYYQETFGSKVKIKFTEEEWSKLNNESKGSNEITGEFYLGGEIQKIPIDYTTFQQEISDEQIEKKAKEFWGEERQNGNGIWQLGAKWYREQLKLKA